MTAKMRLGVVFGGQSVEHEVSVVSAMELLEAADPARFEPVPFGVTPDGRWLTPDETRARLGRSEPLFSKRMEADVPPLLERNDVLRELSRVDVVFPLVHGLNGEDGTLQGMLEMFGLPYAGCGVAASAIGMDKALQKELFRQAGLGVTRSTTCDASGWDEAEQIRFIELTYDYPFFVKPARGGSSLGVSKVASREDFGDAMRSTFSLDQKALIEELVSGREVECGILGNRTPEASPIGEIIASGEFYDYGAKYLDESARIVVPADIDAETATALQEAAVIAYEAIDGAGFARVDFFLTPDGRAVINEVNTLPGFRPASMFPKLWSAAGVTYRDLISRIVDLAIERFGERKRAHV